MLGSKADVARLVVLVVIPAEPIEGRRAGIGIRPDRWEQLAVYVKAEWLGPLEGISHPLRGGCPNCATSSE